MQNDVFFFFSSRRRHTRSLCDWSSDVCSSDLPKIVVEVGISFAVGLHGFETPGLQPLSREVFNQRLGPGISEHAPDLRLEYVRTAQRSLLGLAQQFLVGHAAPQKVGEPRCQFVLASLPRRFLGWSFLIDAEQEIG